MKKSFKGVSIILILALLFTMIPAQVFADSSTELVPDNSVVKEEKSEAKIIGEVTEKREKNVKHFLKDDGTFEAVVYPEAVHYKDGDQWKEIDNTMVGQKDEDNNDVVENRQNDYKIRIAKRADSRKLVSIKKDKYELSWGIKDANGVILSNASDTCQSESPEDPREIQKNISSNIDFKNVYPNVDLNYNIQSKTVKENIIINQVIDNPVFTFDLNVENITGKIQSDK